MMEQTKLYLAEKDIKFIDEKLIKRGYGSNNLKRLVKNLIHNPSEAKQIKLDYVN